jgi:hypothetical protein
MGRGSATGGVSLMAALIAAGLLLAPAVHGRSIDYVSQGMQLFRFEVPDDWQFRVGAEVPAAEMPAGLTPAPRVISVRPPGEDGVMWTGLWSPPAVRNFAEARDYLRRLGPRLLDRPQVGYSDARTVNGRPARVFSGTGSRAGRAFDFVFAIVQIAPERVAIAAFIGEPGIFDRHEEALVGLLHTMEAAR